MVPGGYEVKKLNSTFLFSTLVFFIFDHFHHSPKNSKTTEPSQSGWTKNDNLHFTKLLNDLINYELDKKIVLLLATNY